MQAASRTLARSPAPCIKPSAQSVPLVTAAEPTELHVERGCGSGGGIGQGREAEAGGAAGEQRTPGKARSHLFASAKGGNVTAQIFWLKSRAHWHEKNVPEDPVARGNGEPDSQVVLVLPDNQRDPELTQALQSAEQDALERYFARKSRR